MISNATIVTRGTAVVLNGARLQVSSTRFLCAALLGRDDSGAELPYVFCANGTCRDCNLMVEGLEDVPSCRVPLAALSLRVGEGGGEANALARRLPASPPGEPLTCDVAVVGGGMAGRSAAEEMARRGRDAVILEARAGRPVAVVEGRLLVYDAGRARPLQARALVLATGSRDTHPAFPGSALPGVLPLDVLERYLELGAAPFRRVVLAGDRERAARVADRLRAAGAEVAASVPDARMIAGANGATGVEAVRVLGAGTVEADALGVAFRREPALALAKALGCRTVYDRDARCERLDLDGGGATSRAGVFGVTSARGVGAAAARWTSGLEGSRARS